MSPLFLAELNLAGAIQLQSLVRDEPASVRAEAAKAVLAARSQLAQERARAAMGGMKGVRS